MQNISENKSRFNLLILIIPIIVLFWGIFNINYYDNFSGRAIDPEYPYLINGLNVAQLKFSQIGHYDHPGTPFQVFCGIIIKATHITCGQGSIVDDVFTRPDFYFYAIDIALLALEVFLIFAIGIVGKKRGLPTWLTILLQSGFLFNHLLMFIFCRVFPERWLAVTTLSFIIVYLKYCYNTENLKKFAIWSGIVMGMGMATKFNFLPIIILPLVLVDSKKLRFTYIKSFFISFFAFVLPIIMHLGDYLNFIFKIVKHDGLHGHGEERVFNPDNIRSNLLSIFDISQELSIIIILVIAAICLSAIYLKKKNTRKNLILFCGILLILVLQLLMVTKHFKDAYLIPTMLIYNFIIYLLYEFFFKLSNNNRWVSVSFVIIALIFVGNTAIFVNNGIKERKESINQRIEIHKIAVEKTPKDAFLFIETNWKSSPQYENGLLYGLLHCKHYENYYDALIKLNPNVITLKKNDPTAKIWHIIPVSLDSLVALCRPFVIYTEPDRECEFLIDSITNICERKDFNVIKEDLYIQPYTNASLVMMRADTTMSWQGERISPREKMIQDCIKAIKNTPQWYEIVKQKAIEQNIPLESMLRRDAIWSVEHQQ